ncbi:unnamed protein product [Nippostrongylus brasiliensis]|uniref:PH domain-containing protein n=1 Tax=Nippostrongylus brasiliensis TaxID=27835 RepID=A0A0N4YHC4_NIPBR|nr:unnamed protein product [Nippostrongylus brasiliensis]
MSGTVQSLQKPCKKPDFPGILFLAGIRFCGLVSRAKASILTSALLTYDAIRLRKRREDLGKHDGFVLFRCPGTSRGCVRVRRTNWRSGWCTISPGIIYVWPLDKQITAENRISTPLDTESRVSDSTVQGDRMVWEVQSGKTMIQFAHFDPLVSRAFVTDIRLAIERPTRSALQEFDQRRSLRHDGESYPKGLGENIP